MDLPRRRNFYAASARFPKYNSPPLQIAFSSESTESVAVNDLQHLTSPLPPRGRWKSVQNVRLPPFHARFDHADPARSGSIVSPP